MLNGLLGSELRLQTVRERELEQQLKQSAEREEKLQDEVKQLKDDVSGLQQQVRSAADTGNNSQQELALSRAEVTRLNALLCKDRDEMRLHERMESDLRRKVAELEELKPERIRERKIQE